MVLDMFYEENTKVVVSYLPVWEFFFSMHVLANPEHHVSRKKWVHAKEVAFPDVINEIRELKEITIGIHRKKQQKILKDYFWNKKYQAGLLIQFSLMCCNMK